MMACFLGEEVIDDAELDRLEKLIQEKRKQSELKKPQKFSCRFFSWGRSS